MLSINGDKSEAKLIGVLYRMLLDPSITDLIKMCRLAFHWMVERRLPDIQEVRLSPPQCFVLSFLFQWNVSLNFICTAMWLVFRVVVLNFYSEPWSGFIVCTPCQMYHAVLFFA